MTVAPGQYRWEVRKAGELLAIETAALAPGRLSGIRRSADGANRHEADAVLDSEGFVQRLELHYERGPFSRRASYRAAGDLLRGSLTALSGSDSVETRLGRFREVDGDLLLFKALIISHIRARGQQRFTGRVAMIDPATLIASSPKQTYAQSDSAGRSWSYEPVIGEREQIGLDERGIIVRRVDSRGVETVLAESPVPAASG